MQARLLIGTAFLVSAYGTGSTMAAGYPSDPVSMATGLELAEVHCSACHAVEQNDKSRMEKAPAFRNLGKRYPLEDLEESLAEGIVTGHEGMPEFSFSPEEIDAFLGYLSSIQVK